MTVYVYENIISPTTQEIIKDEIFSLNFPWVLLDNITYSEKKDDNLYGLNHTFLAKDKNILQPIYPYLLPILVGCVDRMGIEFSHSNVLAGRVFMQLPRGDSVQNEPHIDSDKPHWVFLYYVNDSDGDTVFFEKQNPWNNTNLIYGEENFIEIKRVTPKQGTCIVFDGSTYHASGSPTVNKRCVINFNYKQ